MRVRDGNTHAPSKGLYDTHMQPVSVTDCMRHLHIRKQCCAYFSDTETVTRMRVLDEDDVNFTSMDAIFNHRSNLKGQCTDVKSGCGPSVGLSVYPP